MMTTKTLTLAIGLLLFATNVAAQAKSPLPSAAPIAANAKAAETMRADILAGAKVPSAEEAAKIPAPVPTLPQLPVFDALEREQEEQAAVKREIERLSLQKQLKDLKRQLASEGELRMPTLVGIVGSQAAPVAEFVDARGVRTVRAGDSLIPGWRVQAVRENTVELLNVQGKKARAFVLMLGSAAPVLKSSF